MPKCGDLQDYLFNSACLVARVPAVTTLWCYRNQFIIIIIIIIIMSVYDGSVHVFYGPRMWRLTDYGLDSPDYPADTRSIYSHAPSTVDAAVYSTFTHQTYLFSGKTRLFVACQISSGQITAGGQLSPSDFRGKRRSPNSDALDRPTVDS